VMLAFTRQEEKTKREVWERNPVQNL